MRLPIIPPQPPTASARVANKTDARRAITGCLNFLIRNVTRNTALGDAILRADTSATRRTGLLKHTSLEPGHGLWIVPCQGIHMFFMKFALDLVYVGRDKHVKKVVRAIQPWRISLCLTAHSVLELPVGTIDRTGIVPGDVLEVTKNL